MKRERARERKGKGKCTKRKGKEKGEERKRKENPSCLVLGDYSRDLETSKRTKQILIKFNDRVSLIP